MEIYDEDGNPTSTYAFYSHLSKIDVKVGQSVKEGDEVGLTGNSGNAKGMKGEDQHLHFEYKNKPDIKKGLDGRMDPNDIVDTKFEPDPNREGKVRKVEQKSLNDEQLNSKK
jgi:murein DD-endopeptidase MepM/ murein hydrolase activator NlpD